MFKYLAPSEMKNDFVYAFVSKKRLESLKQHLIACRQAAKEDGNGDLDGLLTEELWREANHPVLIYWMSTRLLPAFQGGPPSMEEARTLLEQFPRFFLIPLWSRGIALPRLRVRLDEEGHLYFPGHPVHLALGKEYADVTVEVETAGQTARLRTNRLDAAVPLPELLDTAYGESKWLKRLDVWSERTVMFGGADPLIDEFLGEKLPRLVQEYGKQPAPFELLASLSLGQQWYYAKAMSLIKQYWPKMYGEAVGHIRMIALLKGDSIGALTHSCFQGGIFLMHRDDLMWTAENLIHEFGHSRLDQLFELDDLIGNGEEERYRSPWRDDPRPVKGIVHGLFVFTRIALWYERLLASGEKHGEVRRRLTVVLRQAGEAIGVLRSHAVWTPIGQGLFDELVGEYERLAAIFPLGRAVG